MLVVKQEVVFSPLFRGEKDMGKVSGGHGEGSAFFTFTNTSFLPSVFHSSLLGKAQGQANGSDDLICILSLEWNLFQKLAVLFLETRGMLLVGFLSLLIFTVLNLPAENTDLIITASHQNLILNWQSVVLQSTSHLMEKLISSQTQKLQQLNQLLIFSYFLYIQFQF